MAESGGSGGWRTGGGDIASLFSVRNTKSFRLNNVKVSSWSRNINYYMLFWSRYKIKNKLYISSDKDTYIWCSLYVSSIKKIWTDHI